jgi:hypothetical protein
MDKRTITPQGGKETVEMVWEYDNHTIFAEVEVYSIIDIRRSLNDDQDFEQSLSYSNFYINWVCVHDQDGDEMYLTPDIKKELEEKIKSLITIEL